MNWWQVLLSVVGGLLLLWLVMLAGLWRVRPDGMTTSAALRLLPDLVPDLVPVLGYADDAVVVALALRSVVRSAGADALARHWPGDQAGLDVVGRLAGVRSPTTS